MRTRGKPISILILGASDMQIPAIRIGRELGWRVVVADINGEAPGVALASEFCQVDLKDLEGMTEAARGQQAAIGLDGVFTAGTDFSATVAWVAERLGLPGIPYETALDASDKSRMRAVFDSAGLPSPRFVRLTGKIPESQIPSMVKGLKLPLVIKPVDSMGARGVKRVDTALGIHPAAVEAMEHSRTGAAIVEEYIDGPEFSLDALISDGRIQLCGIADRHIYFPPYFVEMGHTMPSNYPEDDQKRVIDLFFSGIRALGIASGAAKGDIKLSKNGPVIGEIAARLSGGYMSGWTYPYSSGIRVTEAAMRIAVGLPPGDLTPIRRHTAAERAFISIPGTVLSIDGVESVSRSVDELFLRTGPGRTVQFPTNNVQKCGNVICTEPESAAAVERAAAGCRGLTIRLQPFNRDTKEFLFGGAEPWAPNAFSVSGGSTVPFYGTPENTLRGVLAIPEIVAGNAADWHGVPIAAAFSRVLDASGLSAIPAGTIREVDFVLAGLFWRAFLRGGIQGGLWIIDCVNSIDSSADARWTEVLSWCE